MNITLHLLSQSWAYIIAQAGATTNLWFPTSVSLSMLSGNPVSMVSSPSLQGSFANSHFLSPPRPTPHSHPHEWASSHVLSSFLLSYHSRKGALFLVDKSCHWYSVSHSPLLPQELWSMFPLPRIFSLSLSLITLKLILWHTVNITTASLKLILRSHITPTKSNILRNFFSEPPPQPLQFNFFPFPLQPS